jgi:hypothetical protein
MRTSSSTQKSHRRDPVGWLTRAAFLLLAGGTLLAVSASPADAATAPGLGTAGSYGVLGGTTVTNTGATTITGNLGVSPGSAITNTGSLAVSGETHAGDAESLQAQNDVITAFDAMTDEPCTASFVGTDVEIGGQTLIPGVYCYSSSALLTGTLTLNGAGVYIFKTGSTLTTASGSSVAMIGGAEACNVFWQIGSSADLFTNTTFAGTIIALTNINLQTGTTLAGRALARNAAVNLDTNVITSSVCALADTPTPTATTAAPTATSTTVGVATSTSTPVPATSTPTGTPAASTVVASPTSPASTPTAPTGLVPPSTGLPPASPIEPPSVGKPPSRFPETGAGPDRGVASPWSFTVVASFTGGIILALGVRGRNRDRSRIEARDR